jgi:hypothetical protein
MTFVKRRLFWSCLLVLALLIAAVPVLASGPIIERIHIVVDVTIPCPDFDIAVSGTVDVVLRLFFDEDGDFVRGQANVRRQLTYVNLDTGKTVVQYDAFLEVFDPATNTLRVSGLPFSVRGEEGMLFFDAGNIIFDPATGEVFFEAGPHPLFHGLVPSPCEVLA